MSDDKGKPKIVSIAPKPARLGLEPSIHAIDLLEEILVKAKRGDISQIAIAYIDTDRNGFTSYSIDVPFGLDTLIGSTERLKHRLMSEN